MPSLNKPAHKAASPQWDGGAGTQPGRMSPGSSDDPSCTHARCRKGFDEGGFRTREAVAAWREAWLSWVTRSGSESWDPNGRITFVGQSWNLLHTGPGLEAGHPISPGPQPAPVLVTWDPRACCRAPPSSPGCCFLTCFRKRHTPPHRSTSSKHKGPYTNYTAIPTAIATVISSDTSLLPAGNSGHKAWGKTRDAGVLVLVPEQERHPQHPDHPPPPPFPVS